MAGKLDTFTYVSAEDPPLKRVIIRLIERMTGQPHIMRLYDFHRAHPLPGESFWNWAVRGLDLKIAVNEQVLAKLPRTGALVVVANHPFGVLDGIIICYLIKRVRPDFRVMAIEALNRAEEVKPYVLPVDFAETKSALKNNLKSRAIAKRHLLAGGCVIVFPAGEVSTTPSVWSTRAVDAKWKTLTARLILQSMADVVPVYFAGQNSLMFQLISHVSMTLRASLLLKEMYDRIGTEVLVRVGEVIPHARLAAINDREALMNYLRATTYALGQ